MTIALINDKPVSIVSIDDLFCIYDMQMSELGPEKNQAKAEEIEKAMRTGYDQCVTYCAMYPEKAEKAMADHKTSMIAMAAELAELVHARECRCCRKWFYPDVPRGRYCLECWEESE